MQNITTRVAQIFWGLAIIAVDLRAGRIDVLPDFVGYILVALGAAGLVGWSAQFQTARTFSWVLVPFPVFLMLFNGAFLKLLWLVSAALDGALMWFLLGGVIAFAESKSRKDWVSRASTYRLAYLGVLAVAVLTSLIAPVLPGLATFVSFLTLVANLVVMALIIYLFHQVKGEAAGETPSNPFVEAATSESVPPATVGNPVAPATAGSVPAANENPPVQVPTNNPTFQPTQPDDETKRAA